MRSGGACWVAVSKCLECLARSMFYSNKMAAECPYTHRLIARSISMPMHTQIDHTHGVSRRGKRGTRRREVAQKMTRSPNRVGTRPDAYGRVR